MLTTRYGLIVANKIEPGETYDLATMVEYAPGSIVSRSLGKCPGGNLSLFAFDEGQELSEHSTPMTAYIQVLEGEAVLTLGDKPFSASAGDIVLLPGSVAHSVFATTRFKMLLTLLK